MGGWVCGPLAYDRERDRAEFLTLLDLHQVESHLRHVLRDGSSRAGT
jgi:hypothetical protein